MERQPKIIFKSDGDALTNPPQFADRTAFDARQRRVRSPQQKRTGQPYLLQWLTDDARFECADIGDNIRQLRHGYQLARRGHSFATGLRKSMRFATEGCEGLKYLVSAAGLEPATH